MPVFTIDVPTGASPEVKQRVLAEITDALDEAYHFPDTRGWLREYDPGNVAIDGRIGAEPVRPIVSLEAPELASVGARRTLVQRIEAAVAAGYAEIANTDEVLTLINTYPLDHVGWRSSLQSDNPKIVAGLAELNGAQA